jgi:hypothetical protein
MNNTSILVCMIWFVCETPRFSFISYGKLVLDLRVFTIRDGFQKSLYHVSRKRL